MSHHKSLTKFLCLLLIVTGSLLLSALYAGAATINVPADCPTIQAGIDAAQDGDKVMVAPGTYAECIDFQGKGIMVLSSTGPAVTTIDGGGERQGPVVTISNCGQKPCALQGFTLQNGDGVVASAIYISDSSPEIANNIIHGNGYLQPDWFSDAQSIVAISDSTVSASSPVILRNTFQNGYANWGVLMLQLVNADSAPEIRNNVFTNGTSAIAFKYLAGGAPRVTNNTIAGNVGGIYYCLGIGSTANPVFYNNIIAGNSWGDTVRNELGCQ